MIANTNLRYAEAYKEDIRFCGSTWFKGVQRRRMTNSASIRIANTIDMMLGRHKVLVATDDDNRIVGWCCYTKLKTTAVVHYLYVRKGYRGNSLGANILSMCGVDLEQPVPYTGIDGSKSVALAEKYAQRSGMRVTRVPMASIV